MDKFTLGYLQSTHVTFFCDRSSVKSRFHFRFDITNPRRGTYIYDSALDAQSVYALNDREVMNISYVYGAKLNSDGTLLFQPSSNGIDVLDGRLGNLLSRICLPVALSANYDALVADGKDNVLIAITGETGTGIAVVDLSSLKEPAPLPYVRSRLDDSKHQRQAQVQSHLENNRKIVPHLTRHVAANH